MLSQSVYNEFMERILEDIKTGQLKHVYLLYGDESYLIRQYRERLREALVEPGDEINTTRLSGKDLSPEQIIDLAETMPFFSDHRSIFIDDSGFFKSGGEKLADYVKEIPDSAYLIFSETGVDRRSSLFKQVAKVGRAVEFPRQKEDTLTRWVLGRIRREGRQITRSVLEFFLSRTGDDMERISQELEKLLCFTLGKDVIEKEDVEAVCGTLVSDRIFDMVDAVAAGQQKKALELYFDLLLLKESPMRILSMLTREFHIMMQLKEMNRQGMSRDDMADQVNVRSYFIPKYLRVAGKFSDKRLREAVSGGVQAEEDFKTGKMSDRLAVELFLMEYSK